jgi:hypothetical protein
MQSPVFAHRVLVSSCYVSTLKKPDKAEALLKEILDSTAIPLSEGDEEHL